MSPMDTMKLEGWLQGINFGAIMVLLMFFLFQLKHLIVDFFIQNRFPYMWMNKHKLFHWGGWLHAGSHAVFSFPILAFIHPPGTWGFSWMYGAIALCIAEMFIHFFIDMIKMRVGIWTGWKCNTSPQFWNLLGVDQFLHQLTYIWMVAVWVF
jgi:hypothetical protein